jgi:hypothetical protein
MRGLCSGFMGKTHIKVGRAHDPILQTSLKFRTLCLDLGS